MKFGSVCSGIEAASKAWHPLGWRSEFYSEIEPFPSAVLKHHYPETPNYGDMTEYAKWPDSDIDVLVGGTPCQSFSVAGLRKGLADPRGNLALVYLGIVDRYRPRWVVWENVPGVRSSWSDETACAPSEESRRLLEADGLDPDDFEEVEQTSDLDCFTAALEQLGYGWAMSSFDAQYFGVAQRRERVFVIGYLGDWRPPAAVLFEPESLCGDSPPSREKGPSVAALTACGVGTCGADDNQGQAGHLVGFHTTGDGYWQEGAGTLRARGNDSHENVVTAFSCKDSGNDAQINLSPTLRSMNNDNSHANGGGQIAIAFQSKASASQSMNPGAVTPTLDVCKSGGMAVATNMQVRRLTPTECERLQGFSDNYTRIAWNGKTPEDCPDGHRYKALGNSMAVPVMRWIGERIELIEAVKL